MQFLKLWLIVASVYQADNAVQQKQQRSLRCGSYCVYVSLKGLGLPISSFDQLEQHLGQPSDAGYSLLELEGAARHFGAHTLLVTTTLEDLQDRRRPFACIVRIEGSHFVNIYDVTSESVFVIDPPAEYTLPRDTFRSMWDGSALLVATQPQNLNKRLRYDLPLVIVGASLLLLGIVVVRGRLKRAR